MSTQQETLTDFPASPKGFRLNKKGVQRSAKDKEGKEEWHPVTFTPVWVEAGTVDERDDLHGVLIRWSTRYGKWRERAVQQRMFHSKSSTLVELLADGGLVVVVGAERNLLKYLSSFNPKKRLISAEKLGWLNGAFVLPLETINQPKDAAIVYQPGDLHDSARSVHRKGTLNRWKVGMADSSSLVRFFVLASLSASLKYLAHVESGGFHGYSGSSQGKTTVLQAAASVWGDGKDPQRDGADSAYVHRYSATMNAQEARAQVFNDMAFILDEVGEANPRELGSGIYRIMSGSGRGRVDRSGSLRDSCSWRIFLLSMGEIAISAYLEAAGEKMKGGQMVRLTDIDLNGAELFSDAADADRMKMLTVTHYGHAGPDLLSALIGDDIYSMWQAFDKKVPAGLSPMAGRVWSRFQFVRFVGRIAVQHGIVPWTDEQVDKSVSDAWNRWHERDMVSDIERGILSVRDFILEHESRFETEDSRFVPRERAGWKRGDLYHFTVAAFKEACAGADPLEVKKALKKREFLHVSDGGRLSSRIRINSDDQKRVYVTSVKAGIFSTFTKTTGDTGDAGDSPVTTRDTAVPAHDMGTGTPGTEAPLSPPVPTPFDDRGQPAGRANKGLSPLSPLSSPETAKENPAEGDSESDLEERF